MTFAELIGVAPGPIRWGRVFALYAALYLADLGANLLQCTLRNWPSPPPWSAGYSALLGLALTASIVAAFRLVRNPLVAVVAGALGYAVLVVPVRLAVWGRTEATNLLFSFLYFFLAVGALAWAVARIRRPWLALAVGAAAGGVAADLVTGAGRALVHSQDLALGGMLLWEVFSLLTVPLFVGVFLAGWEPPGPRRRLNLSFYTGAVIWGQLLGNALLQDALGLERPNFARGVAVLYAIGGLASLFGAVVMLRLFYKMWAAIQDGAARTTPGRAVGLLFVPLFDVYWLFQILPGFATDYNAYIARHAVETRRLPRSLFTLLAVLLILDVAVARASGAAMEESRQLALALGWSSVVVALVLLAAVSRICRAVNALPVAEDAASTGAGS